MMDTFFFVQKLLDLDPKNRIYLSHLVISAFRTDSPFRCVSWWVSFQLALGTVKGGGCNQYKLNHSQFCGTPILEPLLDHQKSCAFWLCGSSSNSQFLMSDPRSLLSKYLRERKFGPFVLSFLKDVRFVLNNLGMHRLRPNLHGMMLVAKSWLFWWLYWGNVPLPL